MKKDHCLTQGTYQPRLPGQSCTHSITSQASPLKYRGITTTVQLNSIKFTLVECRRYTFKTKHISCCLAGRTPLIQTVGALSERTGRLWSSDHSHSGPLPALQVAELLVTLPPLVTTDHSEDHQQVLLSPQPCLDVGDGTLHARALPRMLEFPQQLAPSWGSPALLAPRHTCAASR